MECIESSDGGVGLMTAQTALTAEAFKLLYLCRVTTEVDLFSLRLTGENETKRGAAEVDQGHLNIH